MLGALRGSFTSPTFSTFAALVTGLSANIGQGTVTGMLLGANLTRHWSHDRAHSFFARARCDPQTLGASLSHLVVRSLVPDGTPLTVAVDDTLSKRRGKKVFGAAWQHDDSATGRDGNGYGTCFVVLGLVVELPFPSRPVCLPIAARLHRPKGEQTKVELAASMIRFLAACHWSRRIDVVADAAYHGRALRDLPASVTFTTRVPSNAVLHALAPPPTGRRGRPRLKGGRLATPAEPAATRVFTLPAVVRYGRIETVFAAETTCLWYGSFHTRTKLGVTVGQNERSSSREVQHKSLGADGLCGAVGARHGHGCGELPVDRAGGCGKAGRRPATAVAKQEDLGGD